MRSYAIFRFIFLFLGLEIVFSQIFINKSFDQDLQKIIFDTGQNWSQLSSISSLRDHDLNNFNTDTLYLKKGIGYIQHNSHKMFYLTGRFIFKKHFFAYYDSQFLNNRTNYSSQLGISNSGVGYRNDWLYLQLGKGRENWGSGSYINLALSDNSAPYNYFKLASN